MYLSKNIYYSGIWMVLIVWISEVNLNCLLPIVFKAIRPDDSPPSNRLGDT
jgi:hypothetical protein